MSYPYPNQWREDSLTSSARSTYPASWNHDLGVHKAHSSALPQAAPPLLDSPPRIVPSQTQPDLLTSGSRQNTNSEKEVRAFHPYRKPSIAGTGNSEGKKRHNSSQQRVRFVSPSAHSPTTTSSVTSSPSSARLVSSATTPMPAPILVSRSMNTDAQERSPAHEPQSPQQRQLNSKAQVPASLLALMQPRRYVPRTDTRFNPRKMQLTAQLELPGVRRQDLSVSLSTCIWNRVRQVVVQGKVWERWKLLREEASDEDVDDDQEREKNECTIVRERKYGEFRRSFAVPYETTVDDVRAELKDGLLFVHVACKGLLGDERECEPQEIMVR